MQTAYFRLGSDLGGLGAFGLVSLRLSRSSGQRACIALMPTDGSTIAVGGILQALVIWAYATIGERLDDACMDALGATARKQLQHFTVHALANLVWSLCILQVCQAARMTLLPHEKDAAPARDCC